MDMRIPPLGIKIMLESNPLKFRILVRRVAVKAVLLANTSQTSLGRRESLRPARAGKRPRTRATADVQGNKEYGSILLRSGDPIPPAMLCADFESFRDSSNRRVSKQGTLSRTLGLP